MLTRKCIIYLTFILLFIFFIPQGPSQTPEQITITTYYPAPYGIYRELVSRRFVVGDDTMPTVDAIINFQGLGGNPAWSDDGALYYNTPNHEFRFFNAGTSNWEGLGGVSDVVVSQNAINLGGGSAGVYTYCPHGYTRIACSGGLDYNPSLEAFWDSGDEDSKGYNGAAPVSGNGCTAFADGGSSIYVWAYCVK